jgi:hypothetical protein
MNDTQREAADEIVRLRQDLVLFANELNVERAKVASLVDHVVRLEAERDEARREILMWIKQRCSWIELTQEIKQRGGEYLKEDGK